MYPVEFHLSPEQKWIFQLARVAPDWNGSEDLRLGLEDEVSCRDLPSFAARHGVIPLLYRNLSALPVDVVPREMLDQLRAANFRTTVKGLWLTSEMVKVLKLFGAHGIDAIPYKGPTLAALAYRDVTLREYGDIDLLVRHQDIATAAQLLEDVGYEPGFGLSVQQQKRFLESLCQLPFVKDDGSVVELHTAVTPRHYAFAFDVEAAYSRRVPVEIGGGPVATLCPEDLLLVLSVHGAKHLWSTIGLIMDVAELIRAHPAMNWAAVQEHAASLHCKRMLRLALVLSSEFLEAPVPDELIEEAKLDPQLPWLVRDVIRRQQSPPEGPRTGLESGRFHLRVRDRLRDAGWYGLSLAIGPRVADWSTWDLSDRWSFFYYLLRPVRLVQKYLRRFVKQELS